MTSPVKNLTPPEAETLPEDGIAERLLSLRERNGWTQAELSKRSLAADPEGRGISRTVLVGYESGKFKPGAREIRILCQTFGVTPNWLLFGQQVKDESFEDLNRAMFAGIGDPDLGSVFRVALALASLREQEREAFAGLIYQLAVSRRGAPTVDALTHLADLMAEDAEERLCEVTQSKEAVNQLRFYRGKKLFDHFFDLYQKAYEERFPRHFTAKAKKSKN